MDIKFFARDIISGTANNVGDKFVAFFMNGNHTFEVTELHGECIFAVFAK